MSQESTSLLCDLVSKKLPHQHNCLNKTWMRTIPIHTLIWRVVGKAGGISVLNKQLFDKGFFRNTVYLSSEFHCFLLFSFSLVFNWGVNSFFWLAVILNFPKNQVFASLTLCTVLLYLCPSHFYFFVSADFQRLEGIVKLLKISLIFKFLFYSYKFPYL